MIVGFTGTRHGMTDVQRASFGTLIVLDVKVTEFHHGSCKGADIEAARIVRHVVSPSWIINHPGPDGDPCREESGVDDEILPPKTHFARNRDIVDKSDILVACPCDMTDQPRGGTWYTVGYAAKKKKLVYIVWPDGRVEKRG